MLRVLVLRSSATPADLDFPLSNRWAYHPVIYTLIPYTLGVKTGSLNWTRVSVLLLTLSTS